MAKEKWDRKSLIKEAEEIVKQGRFNSRLEHFTEVLDREEIDVPEEWQDIFNALFESILEEYPAFACCILAFQMGQTWQKYGGEL